jgi:hypothetical protein
MAGKAALIIVSLLLAACATQQLTNGLQKAMGMPIDVLVADWGYPREEREIMGHKFYIWSNNGGVVAVPVYGGGAYAASLVCTVQVGVDDNKIITSYQLNGNNGGCAAYADRIAH